MRVTRCTTPQMTFQGFDDGPGTRHRRVEAGFDGGRISSDCGLLLFRWLIESMGLGSARFDLSRSRPRSRALGAPGSRVEPSLVAVVVRSGLRKAGAGEVLVAGGWVVRWVASPSERR